jgi:glucokinase
MARAIGIDLGGSSVKAVLVTATGELLAQRTEHFTDDSTMAWAEKVRGLADALRTEAGTRSQLSLGLSAPGIAARDGRCIAYMPGRLQGLENLEWTRFLKSRRPVPVVNDAQAALLGELWLGAARGSDNAILLTLGTGVGGAAVVDGQLLRGHIGRAGHLGHICLDPHGSPDVVGTPGSLEWAVGNATITERTGGRYNSTHELVDAYRAGDAEATKTWDEAILALACGIASLVNVLDPEVVVIGGGIARAGSALMVPLKRKLAVVEWRPGKQKVKLRFARLGAHAGAFGAAYNALRGDREGKLLRFS